MSRWPTRWTCRWWRPTTCISPRRRCTRRMTRSCAWPMGPMSTRTRRGAASRRSIISRARTRWRRCLPICPRRWRIPSRSRGAALSVPTGATRSCRALPMTRWTNCAGRRARGWKSGSPSSPMPRRWGTTRRLDFELGIIEDMGFPGYFLIVADFIKWAKGRDIPVGPGRGSGAGSLVAYALTITDLDPLRYQLLFERFLNPERVSMPDFDIDFCMDRREEVIRYVQDKYGTDKVGQIITFGALLSKAAVRDVGRVLQMPYGQVDRLSKMIPVEGVKPVSIEKALADEPRLREEAKNEEVVARLLDYSAQVEGLLRNASTHAAGVVIGDRPLDELVPLYQDPRSDMPATQFNMKWVEQAGLVKFDFLGLKTLTVIQNAIEQIHAEGRDLHIAADGSTIYEPFEGAENDIGQIPLDDPKTYELYSRARTVAVFQVESSGMMDALKRMKPTCIQDIVALVALYRPGPMENIPK